MRKILLIGAVCLLLVLAACGGEEESGAQKCKTASDCKSAGTCKEAVCRSGSCSTVTKDNCCGNRKCDSSENECSCPRDCGKCEGALQLEGSRGRTTDAQFLGKRCESRKCIVLYDASKKKAKEVFTEFSGSGFKYNLYIKFQQPTDVSTDKVTVELQLKDLDDEKVQPPVTINEVRLQKGADIIGRAPTALIFDAVGSEDSQVVDITMDLNQPEESHKFTVYLDYEYTPLRTSRDGAEPQQVERKTFKYAVRDAITFIDPSLIE